VADDTKGMREFWERAAQENAVWYVDTSVSYDKPDMDRFFATGETVVGIALDESPSPPPGRDLAVEIGSGLGRICKALAPRFDRVVGVDISPEMVRRARTLVDEPNVSFEIGSGSSLQPVADASADLVVSFTVFQHIPKVSVIEGYLAEAGRVLKPGGLLSFQWNNTPGARRWAVKRSVLSALQKVGVRGSRNRNAAEFLGSRVSLIRIQQNLEAAGLELLATREPDTLYTWAWARKT
jgi:SAM-dependent methyltransferase